MLTQEDRYAVNYRLDYAGERWCAGLLPGTVRVLQIRGIIVNRELIPAGLEQMVIIQSSDFEIGAAGSPHSAGGAGHAADGVMIMTGRVIGMISTMMDRIMTGMWFLKCSDSIDTVQTAAETHTQTQRTVAAGIQHESRSDQ